MTMTTSELLGRLSATLKSEIGPAVGDEYTRTQAFMASVILERLSQQIALEPAHRIAEDADLEELTSTLADLLSASPLPIQTALEECRSLRTVAALGPLIEAIYQSGGDESASRDALILIRAVLRRDIDRRMEIAR